VAKLGEALRAAVSEDSSVEEGVAAWSALMNSNRRRVFEYVAWRPCATTGEVARALEVSDPTAAWHLRKLVEAGYVQPMRQGRRVVFHAASLGLEATEAAGLAALSEADAASILQFVLATPGLTASELAAKVTRATAQRPIRALLSAGLIVRIVDGRYRRYYPGSLASSMERTAPRRLRDFRRRLVRRLVHDRLSPEVRAAPGETVEIDLRFGEERATMRLPAGSLLAGRMGQGTFI